MAKVDFVQAGTETPLLNSVVESLNSDMKTWLVSYVGERLSPENDEVTVGMIVETMASEFPEFLMAVAEENWIRGYKQACMDFAPLPSELTEGTDEQNS